MNSVKDGTVLYMMRYNFGRFTGLYGAANEILRVN